MATYTGSLHDISEKLTAEFAVREIIIFPYFEPVVKPPEKPPGEISLYGRAFPKIPSERIYPRWAKERKFPVY